MKRRPGIRTGRLKRNTGELSKWETEGRVVSVSPETHRIDQTFCPHSGQNFAPGERVASHLEHLPGVLRLAPHSGQNLALVDSGLPHSGQEATMVSLQFDAASFLSSADMAAWAQTSS